MSNQEVQALAQLDFQDYRIDRVFVGDRQWEGEDIAVKAPAKNKPYWEISIPWDNMTVFASGLPILIEARKIPKVSTDEDEMPEEE